MSFVGQCQTILKVNEKTSVLFYLNRIA